MQTSHTRKQNRRYKPPRDKRTRGTEPNERMSINARDLCVCAVCVAVCTPDTRIIAANCRADIYIYMCTHERHTRTHTHMFYPRVVLCVSGVSVSESIYESLAGRGNSHACVSRLAGTPGTLATRAQGRTTCCTQCRRVLPPPRTHAARTQHAGSHRDAPSARERQTGSVPRNNVACSVQNSENVHARAGVPIAKRHSYARAHGARIRRKCAHHAHIQTPHMRVCSVHAQTHAARRCCDCGVWRTLCSQSAINCAYIYAN